MQAPEHLGLALAERLLGRLLKPKLVAQLDAGRFDDLPADDFEIAARDVEGTRAREDEDTDPVMIEDAGDVFAIELVEARLERA